MGIPQSRASRSALAIWIGGLEWRINQDLAGSVNRLVNPIVAFDQYYQDVRVTTVASVCINSTHSRRVIVNNFGF